MPEREDLSLASDDEVLAGVGLPTWLRVLSALAIVGVAIALIVPALSQRSGTGLTVPHRTRVPIVIRPNAALDVAIGSTGTWVLEGRTLADISAHRVRRSVPLPGPRFPAASQPMLAVDAPAQRVWVAVANAAPSRMIEFDARTLRVVRDVRWSQLIQDAAALDGHLYVSTSLGVADLAPSFAEPHYVGGLSGAIGPLTLDPVRHRVLAMDLGNPTDIWYVRPGSSPVEAQDPLLFQDGTVAVVDGRIWVGGSTGRGAVLERLDPVTLQPVYRAPAAEFGPGAVIVDGGARVLWARAGYGSGPLMCVSATSGRVEQRWDLGSVNAVASDSRGALVATASGPLGLILAGCAG